MLKPCFYYKYGNYLFSKYKALDFILDSKYKDFKYIAILFFNIL